MGCEGEKEGRSKLSILRNGSLLVSQMLSSLAEGGQAVTGGSYPAVQREPQVANGGVRCTQPHALSTYFELGTLQWARQVKPVPLGQSFQ